MENDNFSTPKIKDKKRKPRNSDIICINLYCVLTSFHPGQLMIKSKQKKWRIKKNPKIKTWLTMLEEVI